MTANEGDAGDTGSISESGRSLEEEMANPLPYSCLGNSMDRGAWPVTVHEVTKTQTRLSDFTFTFFIGNIYWASQVAQW